MVKKEFLLLAILFFVVPALAQQATGNLRFQRFTVKEGLSNNVVQKVCQDEKGFLWVATSDGLNRYDGAHFEKFFPNPKNPNRTAPGFVIRDVKIYKHYVLVGTNTGMGVFNTATNRFENERIKYAECSYVKSRICNNILALPDGDIFLNIEGKPVLMDSLFRLKTDFTVVNKLNPDPLNSFGEPFLADRHLLFMPNSGGIYVYDITKKVLVKCDIKNYESQSATGQLWLCGFGMPYQPSQLILTCYGKMPELFDYDKNNPDVLKFNKAIPEILHPKVVPAIIRRGDNQLWAATAFGILKFNFENDAIKIYSLANNTDAVAGANVANFLFDDSENNLWICTNYGLVKLANTYKRFSYIDDELAAGSKLAPANYATFFNSHNQLIAFTANSDDSMLYVIPADSSPKVIFKKPINLPSGMLNMMQLSDSTYFLSTWLGGCIYNFKTEKLVYPWFIPDTLKTILSAACFQDSRNNIWAGIGTGKGMVHVWTAEHRYDYFNHYLYPENHPNYLPIRYPTVFAEDKNGDIWFAMTRHEGKLIKYSYKTNRFYETHAENCINNIEPYNGAVADMWLDSNNVLWLAKFDDGLVKYNINKNTCEQFTRNNGLCSNYLSSIKADNKGKLWITTSSGLSCFNQATATFKNFYEEDGLYENELTGNLSFDPKNNTMYASGSKKIFSFNPDSLYENKIPPKPYLLYIHVDDSLVLPDGETNFKYDNNNFEFTFTAVNLTDGMGNKYFYKMDGIDKDWKEAGENRQVSYAAIIPGDYTFSVKAKNKSGVWSLAPATYSFHISKPYWETWWFKAAIVAAIAVAVYGLYRVRINRIIELEKMRTRISRDLHDDVGSTLSAINILSTSAKQLTHTDAGRTKDYLENINENAQRMLLNMNDIIWAIKPTEDTLEQLMQRMQIYAGDVLEAKDIWYEIDFPETLYAIKLSLNQKRNLFLIFKEAVNNMAKYSQCTQAKFSFTKDHGHLILNISDNGKGFSMAINENAVAEKNYLSGGNGLINMQKRADEINAEFKITSQVGKGTTVYLRMKV